MTIPSLLRTASALTIASACTSATAAVTWETRRLTDEFHAEGAAAADFNGDGKPDVVYGPYWFEGPDFTSRHVIYEPQAFDPRGYSRNFLTYTPDLNADGRPDVLVLGFPGEVSYWFENPGDAGGLWKRHDVFQVTDNESPAWIDVTGDGRPELLCSTDGAFGYASPGEDPTAPWPFTAISPKGPAGGKFTHGLGAGDVNGDGRIDILEKNGWWEQPADVRTQPVWTHHPFPFSEAGGAQMFAFDIDGDGDNDVLTSLSAHSYGLAWFENTKDPDGKITFVKHEIMPEDPNAPSDGPVFSQLHAIDVADVNGDGIPDFITGKRFWAHAPAPDGSGGDPGVNEPAVLYWYEVKPGGKSGSASFIPHLIHNDSGVGTQIRLVELDGRPPIDALTGNKKGCFVHLARSPD